MLYIYKVNLHYEQHILNIESSHFEIMRKTIQKTLIYVSLFYLTD